MKNSSKFLICCIWKDCSGIVPETPSANTLFTSETEVLHIRQITPHFVHNLTLNLSCHSPLVKTNSCNDVRMLNLVQIYFSNTSKLRQVMSKYLTVNVRATCLTALFAQLVMAGMCFDYDKAC